jgi:hypothetical protein
MKMAAGFPAFTLRFPNRLFAIVVLAAALHATAARAQEVQVPLDRSGRIERIDAQLAKRLGTFGDRYPGFTEARLFRAPDSTFTLDVTMARGGQILRERVPLSLAGVDSLRTMISERWPRRSAAGWPDQEGARCSSPPRPCWGWDSTDGPCPRGWT